MDFLKTLKKAATQAFGDRVADFPENFFLRSYRYSFNINSQQPANQRQACEKSKHSNKNDSNTSNSSRNQLVTINSKRFQVVFHSTHPKDKTIINETQINPYLTETVITVANEGIVNGNVV